MSRSSSRNRGGIVGVPPLRGVIVAFVLFVVIGAGTLIWLDRRHATTLINQETPSRIESPAKPASPQTLIPKNQKSSPSNTKSVLLQVPFIAQAPLGNWADPRQEDGCEEASALMAMRWRTGKALTREEALKEILAISQFEEKNFGSYNDTSAQDTVDRIFKGYFKYDGARVVYAIDADDIIAELDAGNLVVVPAHGQLLANPNYSPPGPVQHMLVIKGYDAATEEFITNDPGTRHGESFRYDMDRLVNSIVDYQTGQHEPLTGNEPRAMIVVDKK